MRRAASRATRSVQSDSDTATTLAFQAGAPQLQTPGSHLNVVAVFAAHHGVQGAVAVLLRAADVVLGGAHRLPHRLQSAGKGEAGVCSERYVRQAGLIDCAMLCNAAPRSSAVTATGSMHAVR